MTGTEMVEKFLCPGCVAGCDTKCGKFKTGNHGFSTQGYFDCEGHVLGTHRLGTGSFALGMPRGFQRPPQLNGIEHTNKMFIYLAPRGCPMPDMDNFNVPTWAMEKEGFLFLHVVSPRINYMRTFVLESRTFAELPPGVVNVAAFYDEMD
jgi:hypothetical protein